MKIIKPGIKPEDQTLRGTCPQCTCVVECQMSEADSRYTDWHIHCPTEDCNQMIRVAPYTNPMMNAHQAT